jgi:hypothetical protein
MFDRILPPGHRYERSDGLVHGFLLAALVEEERGLARADLSALGDAHGVLGRSR